MMVKAMPIGTTILVPPQTDFVEVCWLLAPPPEKQKFPERQGLILSHSERKMWQSTAAANKQWETDEYGRAAPLYWNKARKVWERSPGPKMKWVLDEEGKLPLLKFNKRTKIYKPNEK